MLLTMLLQDKMSKLAEREATINGLQAEINAQQEKTAALLNSLKNALLGFNSDELTVTQKDGKIGMYGIIPQFLTWGKGKATYKLRI